MEPNSAPKKSRHGWVRGIGTPKTKEIAVGKGPRAFVGSNQIIDCGIGVKARGDVEIVAPGNTFIRTGVAYDLADSDVPPELVELTWELLRKVQTEYARAPTESEAEAAAEKSGLKQWLLQHGVELTSLGVAVLALFK